MQRFFIAFFIPIFVMGLEITINYGKEAKEHFSVLNLTHKEPLECSENHNPTGDILFITCVLDNVPLTNFPPTETLYFKFWDHIVDGKFYLYIEPKHKLKLFATPNDLKGNKLITKEQPKKSLSWQIVGYNNFIPFLSEQASVPSKGLNFPIKIIKNEELFLQDLDIHKGPLKYERGEDFTSYNTIKTLMNNHSYVAAIKAIDETLIAFPQTILAKDLLLFRLQALEHFDSVENSDMIIDMGTKWIKKYPTDYNVPEVLYYLGNAYADIKIPNEAKYYFERLINEYPQSRYKALAKMSLAKHYNTGSDAKPASKLFAQAYQEATDVDSASEIAIQWSKFRIQNDDKEGARKILNTMMKANPDYLQKYPVKNYEFCKFLAENELYLMAAKLGEHLYNKLTNNDISKEDLLSDVSLWYQLANNVEDAHRINKIFLQEFEHRPKAEEIRERDDKLLFDLAQAESADQKIQKYDYIIQHYPNSPESEKAIALKAQTLFEEGKYEDVLALKDSIHDSPLIVQSYEALIHKNIQDKNCKQASNYYLQYPESQIEAQDKMPFFDCLFELALNKEAAKVAFNMAQESQDMGQKLAWLYRDTLNSAKLGDFKTTARAGRETLNLATILKDEQYYDAGFVLFNALHNLNDKPGALEIYKFLKENQSDKPQMLQVNLSLLKDAENQKEELSIELYAKDILRLQELLKDTSTSPYVDFALAQSYTRLQRIPEAIEILNDLLQKNISADNQQKALYLKGSLLKASNQDSKETFEQCQNIQNDSAWKNLCSQALNILSQ